MKMTSYENEIFIRNDRLVMIYLHTKFRRNWTSGCAPRYETKKNYCCAHAHYECFVRFTMGDLDRVHWYEQKSSMTLYLLNVIFTFKIAVKGLKFGPNLHSQDDVI